VEKLRKAVANVKPHFVMFSTWPVGLFPTIFMQSPTMQLKTHAPQCMQISRVIPTSPALQNETRKTAKLHTIYWFDRARVGRLGKKKMLH